MTDLHESFEQHVSVTDDTLAATHVLANVTGLSIGEIKRTMQAGAVWLTRAGHTQRLRRHKRRLQCGDTLHCYYDEAVLAQRVSSPALIEHRDAYSVWDKPYGVWSHGTRWGDHCAMTRLVEQALQLPTFVVHRLDRATRGVMLIAHNKHAAAALSDLFKTRRVEKIYHATITGLPSTTAFPLEATDAIDGKPARSTISLLRQDVERHRTVLKVALHTGRKHQARRHLAAAGWPIIGDRLYGDAETEDEDLQLVSASLAFDCPFSSEPLRFESSFSAQHSFSD
ncbi:MAG: RluA family pseudouridine synthase [Pseudomonadota bacterium]